jgi:hypothetical protein
MTQQTLLFRIGADSEYANALSAAPTGVICRNTADEGDRGLAVPEMYYCVTYTKEKERSKGERKGLKDILASERKGS